MMDTEVLARAILDLREHYEDDDELEAALARLMDEIDDEDDSDTDEDDE
mgnify:CR=1 FL=1